MGRGTDTGRLFQTRGPLTANDRSPVWPLKQSPLNKSDLNSLILQSIGFYDIV